MLTKPRKYKILGGIACRQAALANCSIKVGFITTKSGDLESLDEVKRNIEAASKFADISQLGIAPQCGFASTEEGNKITEDDQRRKLDLVVKVAEDVWGGVAA